MMRDVGPKVIKLCSSLVRPQKMIAHKKVKATHRANAWPF
jgi:hypothetical protein